MASYPENLPPYQEKEPFPTGTAPNPSTTGPASSLTGAVQTCSIRDCQVEYLAITRNSATSYFISLTSDPTPLYRVEIATSFSKIGNIQIFSMSDSALPAIAAARLSANPKSKSEPLATICTSSPTLPDSIWRPIARTSTFSADDYRSEIPIVTVPGRAATLHQFSWRAGVLSEPFYQLLWDGPLPLVPTSMFRSDQRGADYIFATIAQKTTGGGENLVEIRRGGGLDFELSVILELFIILHLKNKELI